MTPCQKIKREIIVRVAAAYEANKGKLQTQEHLFLAAARRGVTEDNVDAVYDLLREFDGQQDYESEFRGGTVKTDLPTEYSRHYECEEVAAQMSDGSWIGWTFWFGGGKHGEPEAVEWMEDAYELDVTEEQKLVWVRTFKRKDGQ